LLPWREAAKGEGGAEGARLGYADDVAEGRHGSAEKLGGGEPGVGWGRDGVNNVRGTYY